MVSPPGSPREKAGGIALEAYVRLGGEQRKAMADQLSTISKVRLRERIGRLSPDDMNAVERAICLQLGL